MIKYTTIKIPQEMAKRMKKYMDDHPEYTSRSDLGRVAIRKMIDEEA